MRTVISKIHDAIYKDPLLIEQFYKSPNINNGFLTRILKKSIPCRIGIEFEYSNKSPFINGFKKKYEGKKFLDVYKVVDIDSDEGDVDNEFNLSVRDLNIDTPATPTQQSTIQEGASSNWTTETNLITIPSDNHWMYTMNIDTSNMISYNDLRNIHSEYITGYTNPDDEVTDDSIQETVVESANRSLRELLVNTVEGEAITQESGNSLTEIRFSFDRYEHLVYLYKFLKDMNEFCELDSRGGIHIHIDMTQYLNRIHSNRVTIKHYLKNRLTEIENIFPEYTGKYNRREIGDTKKGTYVNISRLNTLEFRIAPLTFSYSVLMGWIKDLITFRSKLINDIFGHSVKAA